MTDVSALTWDLGQRDQVQHSLRGHSDQVTSFCFIPPIMFGLDPDTDCLGVTGSLDSNLKVWYHFSMTSFSNVRYFVIDLGLEIRKAAQIHLHLQQYHLHCLQQLLGPHRLRYQWWKIGIL